MAKGYLYTQEFWFHVLFLSAFMLPLIVLVIGTVVEVIVKRLTRRAMDGANSPDDGLCEHGAVLCTICHLGKSPRH